jgi:hypothetical protein
MRTTASGLLAGPKSFEDQLLRRFEEVMLHVYNMPLEDRYRSGGKDRRRRLT